jgi:hypothetical protein
MKTLTATLLAAQQKATRLPYLEAKVYDYEQGIKRLYYTRLYQGSEPDNHHGIAFDGQASMHRIRAATGDKLYYQKVASPGPASDYSTWSLISNTCTGPCAIAACGPKVYIFYRTTGNVLWKYYSHDYGASWNNAQLSAYEELVSLAAAWWAAGDNVVCVGIRATFPANIIRIVLNTQTQSTSEAQWYDDNHPLLSTYGIGATYDPVLVAVDIVLAGKESDSPYNHYDLFRTKLSASYNFLALESFLMAPDGEDITYEYPDCHLPASAQDYETTRITAAEKFVGTTPYTLPITCHVVKGTYWSDTTFTEPRPLLDVAPSYGLRITSSPDYWWLSMPSGVWRAPRAAGDPLDISNDIISINLNQSLSHLQSSLVLTLDNSKGQYASPGVGALASLRFRSEVALRLGYRTTAGAESVEGGTFWVDSWQHSSSPNQSLFTIHCLDGWGLMSRWSARYQMRWNKDDVNPKSVWQILYQLLARAGILLTNTPTKPQSSAVNNFYPDFSIYPGSNGTGALNRLLTFVPDKLVFRSQEAFTKNPLPGESSSYAYGTAHVIATGQYNQAVTLSRARALGRADDDSRVVQEALDWDLLSLAIDELDQVYDPNLQTSTRARERADAILRDASLSRFIGSNLVVPTNVGQELLDVVTVTDARCGILGNNYRVLAIQTGYDRRKALYEQKLTLGAP